jgi:hypothetical protein
MYFKFAMHRQAKTEDARDGYFMFEMAEEPDWTGKSAKRRQQAFFALYFF